MAAESYRESILMGDALIIDSEAMEVLGLIVDVSVTVLS